MVQAMHGTTTEFDTPFEARFDFETYCKRRPGRPPRDAFPVPPISPENETLVRERLRKQAETILREPSDALPHPYMVPCKDLHEQIWDNDNFFMGLSVARDHIEHYHGSLLNCLNDIREDGRPIRVHPRNGVPEGKKGCGIPLLAQWCAVVSRFRRDVEWVRPWWDTLVRMTAYFEARGRARRGLFRRFPGLACFPDNDPVVYGRSGAPTADIHMNTWHYREYQAMALLADALGDAGAAREYAGKTEELRRAINRYMWDPIDGMYYALDLGDIPENSSQEITWELHYKVKTFSCLLPLWAGIPTPEQAKRVIEEHVLNRDEFLSEYGLRSLARDERIYNSEPMGGPSNFQGGIWAVATFPVAYGLARYGYREQAIDLAARLVAVYAGDLSANGVLHEYYDAETGAPVMKPGFLSWNLMAIDILENLRTGYDPTDLQVCANRGRQLLGTVSA